MNTVEVNTKNPALNLKGTPFVLLGDTGITQSDLLKDAVNEKINNYRPNEAVPGFWGTLGMADNSPLIFKGNLCVSKFGNDNSTGETLEVINELAKVYPAIGTPDNKAIEHVLNFDNVNFPDFELHVEHDGKGNVNDNIPKLRLTIFLKTDEGALAFYQHNYKDHTDDEPAGIEYILPVDEITNINVRDRITYIFPILPNRRIKQDVAGKPVFAELTDKNFVIKVLTFPRPNKDGKAETIIKDVIDTVNNGDVNNKYALLKFDAAANAFSEVDNSTVKVDTALRTLLLIHGTFTDTEGSFGGLRTQKPGERSWLQTKIDEGTYKQILGFNHPTISKNAADNVKELILRMNADFTGNPVDIITTSRGGLVGKYLFCLDTSNTLPVSKAALIACANGSGYFTVGNNIAKLLGILKTAADLAGNPLGGIILGFAQFGAKVFLNMPGALQMTIGDASLNTILNAPVAAINHNMKIQPIIGDWDKVLVKDEPLIKRLAERGLDVVIQWCLGTENDWVMGTDYQKIMPTTNTAPFIKVVSMHTNYLYSGKTSGSVHKILDTFLDLNV